MKTSKLLLLGLGCALVLPSCSSKNDNPVITEQSLGTFYNVITDLESGETTVAKDVSYSIQRNYTDMTSLITVNGLKLPGNNTYPQFIIGPTKWTFDEAWMNIHASSVNVTANSGLFPNISNLTFDAFVKYLTNYSGTTYTNISYKVNDRYQVYSYPTTLAGWGTTISAIDGTAYDYSTTSPIYNIVVNPDTGKANLTITNFAVAVDKTYMSVSINDLPYAFSTDGDLSIAADKASATLTGVTDPAAGAMPVENMKLTINHGVTDLAFRITIDGTAYNVTCKD